MANGHEEVSWLDWPEPVSYEKGEIFFEDWEIGEELGRGASGSVYLLTKEPMGLRQEAAMKVVHLTPDKAMDQMLLSMGQSQQMIATRRREALSAVVREVAVMMSLRDHQTWCAARTARCCASGMRTTGTYRSGWSA